MHVFDANIFYPHRRTLAFSEANLGAGAMAVPAYWATKNPYFAHNFSVLLAFVLSAVGMYYLARRLTQDRRAAALAAVGYAFCPHVFGRTAQIQLLMTMGLPFAMLAFHRFVDNPTTRRAVGLGVAMAATTYFCAYYGVFVVLMVGFAVLLMAGIRGLWRSSAYWSAVAVAAAVAIVLIAPLFEPYLTLQNTRGFSRPLSEASNYSANWRTYITSSARAHIWMQRFGKDAEVAFPGFIIVILGIMGAVRGLRKNSAGREHVILYSALPCWVPSGLVRSGGGLYRAASARPRIHVDARAGPIRAGRRVCAVDAGRLRPQGSAVAGSPRRARGRVGRRRRGG